MPAADRRAARTAARVLVVPAAALAALTATVPQAAAHTGLRTTTPTADTTLPAPPPEVRLTFSDPMSEKYAQVAVTAADGSSAAEGEPRVSGSTVTLTLAAGTPAGRYTVGYRVVSADGHPVEGSYAFTVRGTGTPASPSARATRDQRAEPEAEETAADSSASGDSALPLVAGAAAVVAVVGAGGMTYVLRRRQRRSGHDG
ncbi:copper resistance protein CopC [Streptomyces sp. NPDC091377]|uniref:copper resistance CopC family protein n=1 Tax=Streptomyces sp. NPDC091377 TaxID=3365995 RepID=UPI00381AF54A